MSILNVATISDLLAPSLTKEASERPPTTRLSAWIMIDFPAPVSPVTTVIPFLNSMFNSWTTTKFLTNS